MEMRGLMGGFYKISEWIMRFSVTNLLWILCNVPFIFFAIGPLLAETEEQLYSGLIMCGVVAPFVFFPATAAMFAVVRKWVMGEEDVPLFKTFFRSYKENYLQAMIGGLVYTGLIVIMVVDYRVYLTQMKGFELLAMLFIGLLLVLLASIFNFFSIMVHYHMKTFQLIKNAIMITVGRPIRSLFTVLFAVAAVFISSRFTFLIPFFVGSIVAYMSFRNFYMLYQKMKDQADAAKKAEEEEAEQSRLEEEAAERTRLEEEETADREQLEGESADRSRLADSGGNGR